MDECRMIPMNPLKVAESLEHSESGDYRSTSHWSATGYLGPGIGTIPTMLGRIWIGRSLNPGHRSFLCR